MNECFFFAQAWAFPLRSSALRTLCLLLHCIVCVAQVDGGSFPTAVYEWRAVVRIRPRRHVYLLAVQ